MGDGSSASENSKSVWDKTVQVEQSRYIWHGAPIVHEPLSDDPCTNFTVAEFFSGCGGTSKGFEMAGFDVVFGSDYHRPSIESFRHNHKKAVTILADARRLRADTVLDALGGRKIDVLIAGVPCQGFSLNNRKRWEKDERNFLFLEFMRFVRELGPRIVLLENVSGLRSTANGSFVHAIKAAIESAGDYSVTHRMLNAADYGVPQLRERIFFVGTPRGFSFEWPEPTHGPIAGIPYRTVFDAISDLPKLESGGEATEYGRDPETEYQVMMRHRSKKLINHVAPRHPESTIKKIGATKPGDPIYPRFTQRIRLSWQAPSPTQVSGGIRPQYQFGHPEQPRGLTVRERARIQSFPDTFSFHGGTVQGRVQTGNAVPPLLAKAIAESIKNVLLILERSNRSTER